MRIETPYRLSSVQVYLGLLSVLLCIGCGSASEDIVLGAVPEATAAQDETAASDVSSDSTAITAEANGGVETNTVGDSISVSQIRISRFLWKPVSEADGNLVVLVDPLEVDILVTGAISENLRDTGPSNDRGTTARGSFPGCRYGMDILVEFFEISSGRRILLEDGSDSVRIEDGCSRSEF